MGSKKSSSASTTNTTVQDQRQVVSDSATALAAGAKLDQSMRTFLDMDTRLTNSGNTSTSTATNSGNTTNVSSPWDWLFESNTSTNTSTSTSNSGNTSTVTTYTATDPGLERINATNAELMRAVAETQSDGVRFMAGLGAETLAAMGDAATNIMATAGSNSTRAWDLTLNKSAEVIDRLTASAAGSSDAARALAVTAMQSYKPAEASANDSTFKMAAIAAGAIALVAILGSRKG